MVLALGLFAASPQLHQQLHPHVDSTLEGGCAVVLFAGGVSLPLTATALPPRDSARQELRAAPATEIHLDSPRYLLRPERGPPGA